MSQLTYKIQSMDARLKKLEREMRGIESLPPFSFSVNPGVLEELMYAQDSELLVYGGAGTGKTSACMAKIHKLCMENPGIRVLVARKTKADVAETQLKAYEELVLGNGHPLLKGASRFNRRSYVYPNSSKIIIGGMDASSRVMGADYDIVYISEATELSLDDWERLSTRLRNGRLPFQMLLADANPSSPNHFLYKRAQANQLKVLKSVIENNPQFYNWKAQEFTKEGAEYLKRFENISSVRYKQLRLGEWVMAEGAIFEEYDPQRHIIYDNRMPHFMYTIAGCDFGHAGAGTLLVFGITKSGEMILIHEVYQTKKDIMWWLGEYTAAQLKFKPVKFMCDPSRPENIQLMRRKGIPNAAAANNKIEYGFDLIRNRLRTDKLKFWHKSVVNPDLSLKEYMQPWRLTEELPSMVYKKGTEIPENTPDHAVDALRYAVAEVDKAAGNLPVGSSTGHAAR